MKQCNPETLKWRGHDLHVCEGCGVRVLDRAAFERRCASFAADQPLTSSVGLYGPDDKPIPQPPEQYRPASHDDIGGN